MFPFLEKREFGIQLISALISEVDNKVLLVCKASVTCTLCLHRVLALHCTMESFSSYSWCHTGKPIMFEEDFIDPKILHITKKKPTSSHLHNSEDDSRVVKSKDCSCSTAHKVRIDDIST